MTRFDNDVLFYVGTAILNQILLPLTLIFFLLHNNLENSRLLAEMYLIQV